MSRAWIPFALCALLAVQTLPPTASPAPAAWPVAGSRAVLESEESFSVPGYSSSTTSRADLTHDGRAWRGRCASTTVVENWDGTTTTTSETDVEWTRLPWMPSHAAAGGRVNATTFGACWLGVREVYVRGSIPIVTQATGAPARVWSKLAGHPPEANSYQLWTLHADPATGTLLDWSLGGLHGGSEGRVTIADLPLEPVAWPTEGSHARYQARNVHPSDAGGSAESTEDWSMVYRAGKWVITCVGLTKEHLTSFDEGPVPINASRTTPYSREYVTDSTPFAPTQTRKGVILEVPYLSSCGMWRGAWVNATGVEATETTREGAPFVADAWRAREYVDPSYPASPEERAWDSATGLALSWRSDLSQYGYFWEGRLVDTDAPLAPAR